MSKKLKIDGLPPSITESQLITVLGNQQRKGGGPVDNIKLIKDGEKCSAIVTFETPEAVDTILERGDTVKIQGVIARVQRVFKSCERTTRSTPTRDAPKNSKTAKAKHSPQDDLSGRESSPEGAKSKPLSEKAKNKPVLKPRTVKELTMDSKRRQPQANSETEDSTSDLDDLSSTDSSHKNEKYKTPKTHKKTVKKGHKEIVDDSSASESSPEKSKNKKVKSVNKSTASKEQSPASNKPSAPNKEPNPQRRKSNTQTRSSDDEDLSGGDTLAEESKYSTRKSTKAPAKGKKSSLAESIPSSSDEDEDPTEPWQVTIKATVKDIEKSKEFYLDYFEDSEISQGPFYEDSLLLDGLKRNVYVTFHTRQAALATVRFKHKPDSNLLKVEMATEGDFDTHSNLLSVHGQLCDTDEQRIELMTAVEQQTKMKVVNIIQHDEPRSAIIVFNPDTCQDVSALTWISLVFNKTRLILAPVFKTNSVKVSGIFSLSSDETLKSYMSKKKRSCGGEVTFFKKHSRVEALVTFKEREDFDGFLGKSDHVVEQCKLHVSAYYQCLSPETYKQISEHVKETHRVDRVDKSHQGHQSMKRLHHPRDKVPTSSDPVHSVQRNTSLHTLSCTFSPLYLSVKCNYSKTVQHTLKLCKFGFAFLMNQSQDLQELMQTCHCKYSMSQKDNCISLALDYHQKLTLKEVKQMTKPGVDALCNYLDTFIAAQCEIDNSYIYEFQEFCQRECQEEKPVVEVFFDHKDNLAVFISEHDEAELQNFVNKMYHKFMSHIPKFDCSAGTPSPQVTFPKGSKNVKQHLGDKENSDTERKDEVKEAAPKQHPFKLEQIIELEEKDLILFQKINFHKEVETRNKPMEIIFNSDTMHATIKGNDMNSINCAQIEMLKKAKDYVRLNVRDIFSPEQLQLLNKKDVQDRINKTFEEKGHQAHFKCSPDVANLFYVKPVDDAVLREIIESHVALKTRILDSDLAFLLKSDKGQQFLSALCESTDDMRLSSIATVQENCLQIISSSQQLDVLFKEVNRFGEENKTYEKEVQFSRGKQLFAKKILLPKLLKITESVTPLGAKIIYNAESVTVQGLKDGVSLGETELSNLSEQIVAQDIPLKFFGIKEFLQTPEGKSLLTNVETSTSCVITTSTTESQAGLSGSPKAFQGVQTQPSKPPNLIAQAKVGECTLWFMQGDITSLKTDAIVHPIDSTLKCQSGLGRALLLRGGNSIQAELADHNMQGIPGEVEKTSAGNLVNCKSVLHVVCPVFTGTEVDELKVAIKACLEHAEKQGIQSLAIPAIGTGKIFQFLPLVACKLLMRSLQQHLTDSSLTKIFFCDVQAENVKELISRFKNVFNESVEEFGELQDKPSKGAKTNEKQFNSVRLTIKQGDITAENCDAIVSGIRDSLDIASSGAVGKALLKQCGSALQDECIAKVSDMEQKGFVTTSAPNLNCKHIYHVSMDKFQRSWDRCISQVLTDAESQGLKSIALPAFGTGTKNADYQRIKKTIFGGVEYFSRNSKGTLKDVRLVIFSQAILDEFLSEGASSKHASDSSQEAEVPPSSVKKVSEQVVLKVYADSDPKIVTATKEINTALKNNFKEHKFENTALKRLSKHQILQLEMEGSKHCVKVSVSVEEGVITMVGFIAEGFMHVLNLLMTLVVAALKDHHKSLTEAVEGATQWQFEQKGKWKRFGPILNSELEKAHKHNAKSHDIVDSKNRKYHIDFTKLKEFQVDENGRKCGRSINVRRYDISQEGEPLPKEWETMGDSENLKLVTLQAGSPEYKNAEQLFIKGGANMPVKKIERVQNRSLYQQHKTKKREMDLRNPKGHVNEQKLFHGTDSTSVTTINDKGFNRSYCGKNATVHVNGVYFSVNSSHSVTYAVPSATGERRMYIASVLTGVTTPSQDGMTYLPNQPGTNIPFDSCSSTEMFIIFHDSQAYPEYLITF